MTEKVLRKRQNDYRKKKVNSAMFKYQRDELLSLYSIIKPLDLDCESMTLSEPQGPVLQVRISFRHSLGEQVNSRRSKKEALPEWYESSSSDKRVVEEFSKIDMKMETKIIHPEPDEYPMWDDPSQEDYDFSSEITKKQDNTGYELNLLKYHRAIGNPFARTLIEHGQEKEGSVYMLSYTKPFEKIWFYKDQDRRVQGPFSTIEMFNWTIRGCFPDNLEISFGLSNFFIAMNVFNSVMPIPDSDNTSELAAFLPNEPKESPKNTTKRNNNKPQRSARDKKDNEATIHLKDLLGISNRTSR